MTTSRLLAAVSFALLVAACACGGKPSPATGPGGGTTTGDDVPPGDVDISKLGEPCGDGDRCAAGACSKYYGIAGPSGPEFSSCEITCASGKGCPAGTDCITIADGPGAVCRASESGPPID